MKDAEAYELEDAEWDETYSKHKPINKKGLIGPA